MNLVVSNLSKHYADVPVFSHVSLTVAPGEFVAIVGESGVGKSTLLNCMAGLDSWDSGTVHLQGADLGQLVQAEAMARAALDIRRRLGEAGAPLAPRIDSELANHRALHDALADGLLSCPGAA